MLSRLPYAAPKGSDWRLLRVADRVWRSHWLVVSHIAFIELSRRLGHLGL